VAAHASARILRAPPRIKVLEALSSIADGRIERVGEKRWRVISSDGSRIYDVCVNLEKNVAYSDDNGTVYRGYIGYPIVAALMLLGIVPYNGRVAEAVKGIPWRKLNEEYKNYKAVEEVVKRIAEDRGVSAETIDAVVEEAMKVLEWLKLRYVSPDSC